MSVGLAFIPLFIFSAGPVFSKSIYFIVEKPWKLELRNQFEQKLSLQDFQLIKPFRPLKLLSKSENLSDGISKAMVVEVSGKRFFILLDESRAPVNKKYSGEWVQTGQLDPEFGIAYLSGQEKLISAGLPASEPILLPEGTEVEKIASQSGRVLVWISSQGRAGWISSKALDKSSFPGNEKEKPPILNTSSDTPDWINSILSESNQVLKAACERTGQNVIRFVLQKQNQGFLVTVENAPPSKFERSFDSLSRKLGLFAGTNGYRAESTDSGVLIKRMDK